MDGADTGEVQEKGQADGHHSVDTLTAAVFSPSQQADGCSQLSLGDLAEVAEAIGEQEEDNQLLAKFRERCSTQDGYEDAVHRCEEALRAIPATFPNLPSKVLEKRDSRVGGVVLRLHRIPSARLPANVAHALLETVLCCTKPSSCSSSPLLLLPVLSLDLVGIPLPHAALRVTIGRLSGRGKTSALPGHNCRPMNALRLRDCGITAELFYDLEWADYFQFLRAVDLGRNSCLLPDRMLNCFRFWFRRLKDLHLLALDHNGMADHTMVLPMQQQQQQQQQRAPTAAVSGMEKHGYWAVLKALADEAKGINDKGIKAGQWLQVLRLGPPTDNGGRFTSETSAQLCALVAALPKLLHLEVWGLPEGEERQQVLRSFPPKRGLPPRLLPMEDGGVAFTCLDKGVIDRAAAVRVAQQGVEARFFPRACVMPDQALLEEMQPKQAPGCQSRTAGPPQQQQHMVPGGVPSGTGAAGEGGQGLQQRSLWPGRHQHHEQGVDCPAGTRAAQQPGACRGMDAPLPNMHRSTGGGGGGGGRWDPPKGHGGWKEQVERAGGQRQHKQSTQQKQQHRQSTQQRQQHWQATQQKQRHQRQGGGSGFLGPNQQQVRDGAIRGPVRPPPGGGVSIDLSLDPGAEEDELFAAQRRREWDQGGEWGSGGGEGEGGSSGQDFQGEGQRQEGRPGHGGQEGPRGHGGQEGLPGNVGQGAAPGDGGGYRDQGGGGSQGPLLPAGAPAAVMAVGCVRGLSALEDEGGGGGGPSRAGGQPPRKRRQLQPVTRSDSTGGGQQDTGNLVMQWSPSAAAGMDSGRWTEEEDEALSAGQGLGGSMQAASPAVDDDAPRSWIVGDDASESDLAHGQLTSCSESGSGRDHQAHSGRRRRRRRRKGKGTLQEELRDIAPWAWDPRREEAGGKDVEEARGRQRAKRRDNDKERALQEIVARNKKDGGGGQRHQAVAGNGGGSGSSSGGYVAGVSAPEQRDGYVARVRATGSAAAAAVAAGLAAGSGAQRRGTGSARPAQTGGSSSSEGGSDDEDDDVPGGGIAHRRPVTVGGTAAPHPERRRILHLASDDDDEEEDAAGTAQPPRTLRGAFIADEAAGGRGGGREEKEEEGQEGAAQLDGFVVGDDHESSSSAATSSSSSPATSGDEGCAGRGGAGGAASAPCKPRSGSKPRAPAAVPRSMERHGGKAKRKHRRSQLIRATPQSAPPADRQREYNTSGAGGSGGSQQHRQANGGVASAPAGKAHAIAGGVASPPVLAPAAPVVRLALNELQQLPRELRGLHAFASDPRYGLHPPNEGMFRAAEGSKRVPKRPTPYYEQFLELPSTKVHMAATDKATADSPVQGRVKAHKSFPTGAPPAPTPGSSAQRQERASTGSTGAGPAADADSDGSSSSSEDDRPLALVFGRAREAVQHPAERTAPVAVVAAPAPASPPANSRDGRTVGADAPPPAAEMAAPQVTAGVDAGTEGEAGPVEGEGAPASPTVGSTPAAASPAAAAGADDAAVVRQQQHGGGGPRAASPAGASAPRPDAAAMERQGAPPAQEAGHGTSKRAAPPEHSPAQAEAAAIRIPCPPQSILPRHAVGGSPPPSDPPPHAVGGSPPPSDPPPHAVGGSPPPSDPPPPGTAGADADHAPPDVATAAVEPGTAMDGALAAVAVQGPFSASKKQQQPAADQALPPPYSAWATTAVRQQLADGCDADDSDDIVSDSEED